MKSVNLFLLSLVPAFWIGMLALTYYTNYDAHWWSVLVELLTIPILLGSLVLLFFAIKKWSNEKFEIKSFSLAAIFLIVTSLTIFFIN